VLAVDTVQQQYLQAVYTAQNDGVCDIILVYQYISVYNDSINISISVSISVYQYISISVYNDSIVEV
jgi:hypothetical protein